MTNIQFVKLQQQIENLIQPETDAVRIYILDTAAVKKAIAHGSQKPECQHLALKRRGFMPQTNR